MARNQSTHEWHTNGLSERDGNEDIVIRYNIWHEVNGTALIAGINGGGSMRWKIYRNIFSNSIHTIRIVVDDTTNRAFDWEFYNNTIVAGHGSMGGLGIPEEAGANNAAYNNVWYRNTINALTFPNADHDYNWYFDNIREDSGNDKDTQGMQGETHPQLGTDNPFAYWDSDSDPGQADLSMKPGFSETGMTLSDEFKYDMFGNERGADGVWDRGAIEYCE